ncbi:MAG: zinc-binding alcohol dehydrogenase [Steroidobacteraceae bacterium]
MRRRSIPLIKDGPALDHALAFWITAPGQGELRREALHPPAAGEVIVQALFSGVSRGTESLVFRGGVPASQYARMRAPFQQGEFPAPVKYGYASVGTVLDGPPELRGRNVFCLYPHQDRYVVPADAVLVLPDALPPERAVLAANLETAINGLWDAAIRPGDRVAVIGAGSVGCLAAWLAGRIPGCRVQLIDVNPARATVARALGVEFAAPARADGDADVVLHASGSPAGLALALRLAGFEATIVELSWYGDREVLLPLGEDFHSRRLTIRASQVGVVAAARRARWTTRARLELALSLLVDAAPQVLIDGESHFRDLPATMAGLAHGQAILHRVRYD